MNKKISLLSTLIFLSASVLMRAQCDPIAAACERHIMSKYISDGQAYRALLSGSDVAEFETTLLGGNTYRIAACSGTSDSNLIFKIFDEEKNLLFSNADYSNAPYWDFSLQNTMILTIEATLDITRSSSGCAVLVIGFER
ncbi:MAG: hypothetical protein IT223_11630 [Crocinitomicaceae bacterium]|nr:hypothetical protein [Crocinitomicaceae bacterium]